MTKKIFLALAALTALTLSFSSCKKDNQGGKNPKTEVKLRIDNKDVKVVVGKTAQLSVAVEPADTKCTFESANADIATVSDSGLITGVKAGKTVITVKAGDATKTANVEVIDAGSMDANTGIGSKDKDIPHFIYIPADKAEIKKDNLDVFKTIMTAAGWTFYKEMYDYKDNSNVVIPFQSPKSKDGYNFLFSNVLYLHSLGESPNHIQLGYPFVYEKDPFAPDVQQKNEEEEMVSVFKAYGFNENSAFNKSKAGENLWIGFNNTSIKGISLAALIISHKLTKEEVEGQPEFEGYYEYQINIFYNDEDVQSKDLVQQELSSRSLRLSTPLRTIK